MTRGSLLLATAFGALALVAPSSVRAQDSQFGIRGLGTPGRGESVRARATGGAFAPFDPYSPLVDASIADVRRVTASVTGGTSWRTVDFGTQSSSLHGARFPAFIIAGPISPRLAISGGFSTYLDRSFGVTTRDTIDVRGNPEPVTDEVTSDGGVTDLRIALAARVHKNLALGFALHGLTGSTRVTAVRRFDDSTTYRTSTARDELAYHGLGGSASALFDLNADLRLAAWARSDTHLRADIRGRTVTDDDLPFSFGGGVRWPGATGRGRGSTPTTRSTGRSAPSLDRSCRRSGSACAAGSWRSVRAPRRRRSSASRRGSGNSSRAGEGDSTSASSGSSAKVGRA